MPTVVSARAWIAEWPWSRQARTVWSRNPSPQTSECTARLSMSRLPEPNQWQSRSELTKPSYHYRRHRLQIHHCPVPGKPDCRQWKARRHWLQSAPPPTSAPTALTDPKQSIFPRCFASIRLIPPDYARQAADQWWGCTSAGERVVAHGPPVVNSPLFTATPRNWQF